MQILSYGPIKSELAVPEEDKQSLLEHLIEPFGNEAAAKSFWQEYPSTIFIFNRSDTFESLSIFNESVQEQIKFGMKYPEYTEHLNPRYMLQLAITNDEGSGIYLVIPSGSDFYQQTGVDDA